MNKVSISGNIFIFFSIIVFLFFSFFGKSYAQNIGTLQQCIDTALKNNLQIKIADLSINKSIEFQKTAFNLDKTLLQLTQDPTSGGNIDNSIAIIQDFSFPTVYINQSKVLEQETLLAQKSKSLLRNEIIKNVSEAYYNLLFGVQKHKLLQKQDSIYNNFLQKAILRYNTGETSILEKINAETKYKENQLLLKQANTDISIYQLLLQKLLNSKEQILIIENEYQKLPDIFNFDTISVNNNPLIGYYDQKFNVNESQLKLEQNKFFPDFSIGYFHQGLIKDFNFSGIDRNYFPGTRVGGIQIGLRIPLFFGSQKAKVASIKINSNLIKTQKQEMLLYLQNNYTIQYNEYIKVKETLDYYESIGIKQADDIFRVSNVAYSTGEIGYIEYIQNLQAAINTKLQYIEALNRYNQSIILLNYLKGN